MSEQEAPQKKTAEPHAGIRPEMIQDWAKYEKDAIENEPGEAREYALAIVRQVSRLIKALDSGMQPIEALKLVEPNTSFVMMSPILQSVCAFSVHGETFRKWWNQWHERRHPDDVEPPTDREPVRAIFRPWRVDACGKVIQLTGVFDPSTPLTKKPEYLKSVNAAIKALRDSQAPPPSAS